MNTSVIRYLLGYILKLEGFLLLLPCIVAGIYYEKSGIYFLIVALISIAIGFIFSAKKPRDFTFYLKEGCATTALGWIVLSIFGCLPFYISGAVSYTHLPQTPGEPFYRSPPLSSSCPCRYLPQQSPSFRRYL